MNLVNLTAHNINVADEAGAQLACIPSSGLARVGTVESEAADVCGYPAITRSWSAVEGLPEPDGESIFIVSSLVLAQVPHRDDVVAPDTGATAIRDDNGRPVAVRRFVRN